MSIDPKKLPIKDLKVLAFDIQVHIAELNQQAKFIMQLIAQKSQEERKAQAVPAEPVAAVEPVKEHPETVDE